MSIKILREVLEAAPNNHYVVQTTVRYSTIREALADHEAMREEAQRQTDRADAAEAKLVSMGVKPCPCLGISCLGCPDCGAVMGDATYREMFGDRPVIKHPALGWTYGSPIGDDAARMMVEQYRKDFPEIAAVWDKNMLTPKASGTLYRAGDEPVRVDWYGVIPDAPALIASHYQPVKS